MYCHNFVEDFSNKVAEKICNSCKALNKICKGPRDFNYISPEICDIIIADFDDYGTPSGEKLNTYYDVLLSCLHNNQLEMFTEFLRTLIDLDQDTTLYKIRQHANCLPENQDFIWVNRSDEHQFFLVDPILDPEYAQVMLDSGPKIPFRDWFYQLLK